MSKLGDKWFLLVLGLMLLASLLILPAMAQTEWGYRTAYQGLDVEFHAVKWNGHLYTEQNRVNPHYNEITMMRGGIEWTTLNPGPSAVQLHDRLNFDPDMAADGKPNILGSCDPVSVDTSIPPKTWMWTLNSTPIINNNGTHIVTSTEETTFTLYRFTCDWSLNLYMGGSHAECYPHPYTYFNDVQIYLRVTPNNFLYFLDNPDAIYIAPTMMQLAEQPDWYSHRVGDYQSIYPGAKGESVGFYYALDGQEIEETTILQYEGVELDPRIFRDEYYIRIGLDTWRPVTEWGTFHFDWFEELPSVQLTFRLDVFVVGQWTVHLETAEKIPMDVHDPIDVEKPTPILDLIPDPPVLDFTPVTTYFAPIMKTIQIVLILFILIGSTAYLYIRIRRENKKDR